MQTESPTSTTSTEANANTLRSKDWITHFRKGRDPIYFAEVFLGCRLNPAQRRFFLTACRTKKGWGWVFRRAVHVSGNQTGKTLSLAIAVLWAATYKIGVKNDNWDRWLSSPYNWFHLAPTYSQTLLLMNDMRALMQGAHPAQYDRETGQKRPVYWDQALFDEKKFGGGTYPGFLLFNGSVIHFRTSDDKAKALQGVRAHGISFDEAAFELHLKEILNEAVKLRLVSTGGPLWLVSTPNGINDYFEVVQEVLQKGTKTFHSRVWEAPKEKLCLVWSHISDNIGFGLTDEDVEFMEMDVDSATKEQQLRGAFLEPKDAFFVPSRQIIKAFTSKLIEEEAPKNDHRYVIFWDVSIATDPTVVVVLDVTRKPWKGVYFRRWTTPMPLRELLSEMYRLHAYYGSLDRSQKGVKPYVVTGFDASGMGGVIIRKELERLTPQRPVNMTGSARVKDEMLTTLRALLSKRDLYLPKAWNAVMREILNYRRDDKHIVQDCVIALAGAAKLATEGFSGVQRKKFDTHHRTFVRNTYVR